MYAPEHENELFWQEVRYLCRTGGCPVGSDVGYQVQQILELQLDPQAASQLMALAIVLVLDTLHD